MKRFFLVLLFFAATGAAGAATLQELSQLPNDSRWGALVGKVRAAAVVKASAIVADGSSTAAAKAWAKECFASPSQVANVITFSVIGANAAATVDQIFNASDNAIQSNVDEAVDNLYGV